MEDGTNNWQEEEVKAGRKKRKEEKDNDIKGGS